MNMTHTPAVDSLEQAMKNRVIAGINPVTRTCVMVGIDSDDTWAEVRRCGFIAVPMTKEVARSLWGQTAPDVYAVALQAVTNDF